MPKPVVFLVIASLLIFTFVDAAYADQVDYKFDRQGVVNHSSSRIQCPPWSYYDTEEQRCNRDFYYAVDYFEGHTYLRSGYCATYDNDTELVSLSPCPYFKPDVFDMIETKKNIWYIKLPDNISELNDFMCGPMNRKGRVCSECEDGFGLAVTSTFNIQCSNCTDVWYAIPLYLCLEFVPVTIFYLVIVVFQFNITSAPMTCYIMTSQLIPLWWSLAFEGEDMNVSRSMFSLNRHTGWFRNIMLTLYDIWNLRFYGFLVPPFCISSKLKPFHISLLGYISVFYPLCLIAVTWISIELHDRNFKPLVWLWRPFHGCFSRLQRRWDKKNDIIDVFASFFLLSFSKVMYQSIIFTVTQTINNNDYNHLDNITEIIMVTSMDLNMTYGSTEHIAYLILPAIIWLTLNILPTLLLFFYPFKVFRVCLSKCRLDGPRLNAFVEKFYGC